MGPCLGQRFGMDKHAAWGVFVAVESSELLGGDADAGLKTDGRGGIVELVDGAGVGAQQHAGLGDDAVQDLLA